jgi:hypothetical protein
LGAYSAVSGTSPRFMTKSRISGQELPAELAPETTQWPSSQVQRLLDTR